MDVEIFPAEKSCEQRCPACPMALKDGQITATQIDKQVQETYSILEHLLKEHSIEYNLHYAASFNLFPEVKYPELIYMGRFETNKSVSINGNAKHFSDNIKTLLRGHAIHPKRIGFSIVPDFPIVSACDSDTITAILEEIQSWHFAEGGTEIEVTVRSNLITEKLFEEVLPKVSIADNAYLKSVLENFSGKTMKDQKPHIFKLIDDNVYYSRYETKRGDKKVTISNRIISGKKPMDIQKNNVAQLYAFCPWNIKSLEIAIAPRGVMFMHSSMSINNPAFWLSHSDFRSVIKRDCNKPNFNILEFAQTIVNENGSMYESLFKNVKTFHSLSFTDFLQLFEHFRKRFKKQK